MVSSLLLTLATLQGVRAWGALGHATVAYIAQNYVTDEVAAWFVNLETLGRQNGATERDGLPKAMLTPTSTPGPKTS